LSRPRAIRPAQRPLDATVVVPGSKSIANRALVCAALAPGRSALSALPDGDDTVAMARGLGALGIDIAMDADQALVTGSEGAIEPAAGTTIDSALAGTTSRFLTAVAALSEMPVVIDGGAPLRRRPMAALHDALTGLGATVESLGEPGHLPVRVARGDLHGGSVALPGDVSSQFLTALMLIGPLLPQGLHVELTTDLVSRPYVGITASVMAAFGADGVQVGEREVVVPASGYQAADYIVEPDASSASYPFAAAAICGGRVHVPALGADSLQGDVRFLELLERMGCTVTRTVLGTTVQRERGTPLRGVWVDMADVSDLVPTLAVVAAFATTPTDITGVGFIRAKESNRIDDVVGELARLGIAAEARPDGMRITPGGATAAEIQTHHDHRLAMAFALAGLLVPGLSVADPDVVTKSWPGYWSMLDAIIR
jgi:3-phosphoshikimate 1-carboxyvinyltransferase